VSVAARTLEPLEAMLEGAESCRENYCDGDCGGACWKVGHALRGDSDRCGGGQILRRGVVAVGVERAAGSGADRAGDAPANRAVRTSAAADCGAKRLDGAEFDADGAGASAMATSLAMVSAAMADFVGLLLLVAGDLYRGASGKSAGQCKRQRRYSP